jgi:hypothetical protein
MRLSAEKQRNEKIKFLRGPVKKMNFDEHFVDGLNASDALRYPNTTNILDLVERSAIVWGSEKLLDHLMNETKEASAEELVPFLNSLIKRGLNLDVTWTTSYNARYNSFGHACLLDSPGWALAILELAPSIVNGSAWETALRSAIDQRREGLVSKLLEMRDTGSNNFILNAALIQASRCACASIVENLLKVGAHVNARGDEGDTPLHSVGAVCPRDHISVLLCTKMLLSHGADPSIKNKCDRTALESLLYRNNHGGLGALAGIAALFIHGNSIPPRDYRVDKHGNYACAIMFVMHQVVRAELATIRDGTQSDAVRRKMRLDAKTANMLDLRTVPYHTLPEAIDLFCRTYLPFETSVSELKSSRNALLCTLRELAEVIHESPDGRAEAEELCDKDTKSYETKRRKTKK